MSKEKETNWIIGRHRLHVKEIVFKFGSLQIMLAAAIISSFDTLEFNDYHLKVSNYA